jgi:hypothetical protein
MKILYHQQRQGINSHFVGFCAGQGLKIRLHSIASSANSRKGIMKKLLSYIILLSVMSFTPLARSQSVEAVDPGFVLLDVLLYRPAGFVATVVGSAVFVGMSPLTAFASIPAPHDAFNKTFNILVLAPAAYTFVRPVGDRRFAPVMPTYRAMPTNTSRPNSIGYQRTPLSIRQPVTPSSQNLLLHRKESARYNN